MEIAFIQRFVLFLGHPVYALTVVVFLLLLSSGAGSMVSRWWLAETSRVWLPLLLIAAALLLYVGVLPGLLGRLVGWPFMVKLRSAPGFWSPWASPWACHSPPACGPWQGRQAVNCRLSLPAKRSGNMVEWAWAMNAASSVLGSVLAIIIAIQFGLNVTLASGAAAYLVALLLATTLRPTHRMA